MAEVKTSYTISCSSAFRDAVTTLAEHRRVNAADLARSVMLVLPDHLIALYPDPGEPPKDDRETVVLRTGPSAGKTCRRKPRLQVRLPSGLSVQMVRKALNLALALASGTMVLDLADPSGPRLGHGPVAAAPSSAPPPPSADVAALEKRLGHLQSETERLKAILDVLSFAPLHDGVRTRGEALFVFGYPPTAVPDSRDLRGRFRVLATVHHPDSPYGDHRRMSQLNAAMDLLRGR